MCFHPLFKISRFVDQNFREIFYTSNVLTLYLYCRSYKRVCMVLLVYLTVEVDWRQNFVEHQWLWGTVQPAGPCSHTVAARHRPLQQVRCLLLKETKHNKGVKSERPRWLHRNFSESINNLFFFRFFFFCKRWSCCLPWIKVHKSLNNRIINIKWAGTESLEVEYVPCLILSAVTNAFRSISVSIFPYSITGQDISRFWINDSCSLSTCISYI